MPKSIQDKQSAENKDEKNKDAENAGGTVTDSSTENENGPDKGNENSDGGNSNQNDDDKDLGFPKDTPLVEMTSDQREAYWKHNSRKHEDAKKELQKILGDLTAADIASLKDVQEKYDALVESSSTGEQDHAEALKNAKEEGAREQREKFAPVFLDAELKALLGERYDADRLTKILSKIKTTDFFLESGEVDSDAVKDYFDDMFLPVESKKQEPKQRQKHGGNGPGDGVKATGVAGASLYHELKNKKF